MSRYPRIQIVDLMMRLVALLAGVGYVASLITYWCTFDSAKYHTLPWWLIWMLAFGSPVLLGIALILKRLGSKSNLLAEEANPNIPSFFSAPDWFYYLGKAMAVFVVINMLFFPYLAHEGDVEYLDGEYCLMHKGKISRILTRDDYYERKAYKPRIFTPPISMFYLVVLGMCAFPPQGSEYFGREEIA